MVEYGVASSIKVNLISDSDSSIVKHVFDLYSALTKFPK